MWSGAGSVVVVVVAVVVVVLVVDGTMEAGNPILEASSRKRSSLASRSLSSCKRAKKNGFNFFGEMSQLNDHNPLLGRDT